MSAVAGKPPKPVKEARPAAFVIAREGKGTRAAYTPTAAQKADILERVARGETHEAIGALYGLNQGTMSRLIARLVGRRKYTLEKKVAPKGGATPVTPVAGGRKASFSDARRIMEVLDKHFDEDKGAYLDGQSDARVAEKLGMPRVFVEHVREEAYGPLKVRPGEMELRLSVEKYEGRLKALEAEFEKRLKEMRDDLEAMFEMLAKL